MDVGPPGASLAPDVARGNIVVLRSFGKFFGLAGVRLGFALAAPPLAARLSALLGPWAVSGPALAVGAKALADRPGSKQTRRRLAKAAARLDAILTEAGLDIVGGTTLFRLVRTRAASELFHHLGRAGILVRVFPDACRRGCASACRQPSETGSGCKLPWLRMACAFRDKRLGFRQ